VSRVGPAVEMLSGWRPVLTTMQRAGRKIMGQPSAAVRRVAGAAATGCSGCTVRCGCWKAGVRLVPAEPREGHDAPVPGQDAIAAEVRAAMRPDDYAFATHRGTRTRSARGAPMDAVMGELLGRANGLMAGRAARCT
jgi:hypothetical protein